MSKHVVFISLPMSGIPDDIILQDIESAKAAYLAISGWDIQDVAFINNFDAGYYTDEGSNSNEMVKGMADHRNVWFLGHALLKLSRCDEAFFWAGWRKARGCMIEHEVCTMYNIPTTTVDVTGGEEV